MNAEIDIQVATEVPRQQFPSDAQLCSWAKTAVQADKDFEVTIRLVDVAESQHLNHQYRQKDSPTNVLSFPFEAPESIDLPLLGDLVICAPLVAEEAVEQKKTLESHWAHLVIHGMLHLQGYDHLLEHDAEVMENLEIELMASLGFPDPYAVSTPN